MSKLGFVLFVMLITNLQVEAFWGNLTKNSYRISKFIKSSKSLRNNEIVRLSKISDEVGGTRKVGEILGRKNLPKSMLADTYLRIIVYQNKISRQEAELFYKNLSEVEGFATTLRKIIGNSPSNTVGQLNELRIANNAAENGFKVVGIGKKFDDGIKKGLTDIDVIFTKNNKTILIEAKNYSSKINLPIDKFKADLKTLNSYANNVATGKSIKVFTFTRKPKNKQVLKQYQFWADKNGVQLIFGTPAEQIQQIRVLEKIL